MADDLVRVIGEKRICAFRVHLPFPFSQRFRRQLFLRLLKRASRRDPGQEKGKQIDDRQDQRKLQDAEKDKTQHWNDPISDLLAAVPKARVFCG